MSKTPERSNGPLSLSNTGDLCNQLVLLSQQLMVLQEDVTYLKDYVFAKQQKKQRRRDKKEHKRLLAQQERLAAKIRREYEEIVCEIKRCPWQFMPSPEGRLTPKEAQLVSLLARGKSDAQIAKDMQLNQRSILPRIYAAKKKLGLSTRQDLISHYENYRSQLQDWRHKRALTLLRWLLDPPPGFIHRSNLELSWKRTLGLGRTFRYGRPSISIKVFDSLRPFEHSVLTLAIRGLNKSQIAQALKIKEGTLRSYFGDIRGTVRLTTGVTLSSQELTERYREYFDLKQR